MPTTTYTPIASVTLSASASEVVFSGLPQTYRDLILVFEGQSTANTSPMFIRVNGDTGSNYSSVMARGNGSNAASATTTTTGAWVIAQNDALGTVRSNAIAQIMDYSVTDKHKTILTRGNNNSSGGASVEMTASRWANTAAVTSIQVYLTSNSFASASTFNLFGVIA